MRVACRTLQVPSSSFTEMSNDPLVGGIQASLAAIDATIKSSAAKLGSASVGSSFAEARKAGHAPATMHKSQHHRQRRPQDVESEADDDSVSEIEVRRN